MSVQLHHIYSPPLVSDNSLWSPPSRCRSCSWSQAALWEKSADSTAASHRDIPMQIRRKRSAAIHKEMRLVRTVKWYLTQAEVFWVVVTQCRVWLGYLPFEGPCCVHPPRRCSEYGPPKRWYLTTKHQMASKTSYNLKESSFVYFKFLTTWLLS